MKPYLVLDCYLEPRGAARFFLPLPGDAPAIVVRTPLEAVPSSAAGFAGVIVTGSAASVLDDPPWLAGTLRLVRDAARSGVPLLGVCFGHQVLAAALFGRDAVRRSPTPELGWLPIETQGASPLLAGFGARFRTFVSHFDEVVDGHPDMQVLARSERCAVHAFQVRGRPTFGVQFHAEMDDEEAERLVRVRTLERPELGLEAESLLRTRVDSRPLCARLLANFVRAAQAANGDARRATG